MLILLCCSVLSALLSLNSLRTAVYVNQGNLSLMRTAASDERQVNPLLMGGLFQTKADEPLVHAIEINAREAIHLRPRCFTAYRLLARAFLLEGKTQDAHDVLERASRFSTADPMTNAMIGWFAWTGGDQAGALAYFRQAPGVEIALARQAAEWANAPATQEQALALYQTAMTLVPKEANAYYDYADLLVVSGQREEAPVWYERGRVYESVPVQFYQRRAGMWLRLGQPEMAIGDYQQAIQLEPGIPLLHYALGDILRDQGRLSEALESYERGRENDRDTAWFHMRKGVVYAWMGRTEDAVVEMREAIRVEPTNYRPYFELGQVLRLYADDMEGALVAYREAFQLAPHEMWPYVGIGEVYRAQARYDQAAEWFSRARAIAPYQSEPLYFLGLNALNERDVVQAVIYLEQAVAMQNDRAIYYRYLGEAYAELGQWEAAIQAYTRLLALDPDSTHAQQRLAEWEAQEKRQE